MKKNACQSHLEVSYLNLKYLTCFEVNLHKEQSKTLSEQSVIFSSFMERYKLPENGIQSLRYLDNTQMDTTVGWML